MSALRLSLLDFCDVEQRGLGPLCTTLELAMLAERLGFHRYWLAEHYQTGGAHCDALMASFAVASVTERIRVGPAGVLAAYRQPFHIASSASALCQVFDERIDIGLAAGGVPPGIEAALRAGGAVGDPRGRIEETIAYLRGQGPTPTIPAPPLRPAIWSLGSGPGAADRAAALGTRLCVSLAHTPEPPEPSIVARYRAHFVPTADCPEPEVTLLVAGTCCASEDAAKRAREQHANPFVRLGFSGTAATVGVALRGLAERYQVDELVILDVARSFAGRVSSLELLADAMHLSPAGPPAPEALPASLERSRSTSA